MALRRILSTVLLLAGLFCLWLSTTTTEVDGSQSQAIRSVATQALQLENKAIQDIQVGERTAGRNPIRDEVETWQPNRETWKEIRFHMRKQSGSSLWITLIRPDWWIESKGAYEGGTIQLDLPEMGALGEAEVIYIGPCPEIGPGDEYPVVTGTFKHEVDENSHVISLRLEGQDKSTGVTSNHPYWSVDRRAFVPAGELQVGETVNTMSGTTQVATLETMDYSGFLYNLETTEHVYRVGAAGTLVHNACPVDPEAERYRKYWESRASSPNRYRDQVAPGTRSVTDQKLSRETGELYNRESIYDEYGRRIGTNDFTTHGRGDHTLPHHHLRDPITGERSGPLPGLHPNTP